MTIPFVILPSITSYRTVFAPLHIELISILKHEWVIKLILKWDFYKHATEFLIEMFWNEMMEVER